MKRVYLPIKTTQSPKKANFKVLQWNILADGLAQHGDFIKVPKDVLEWDKRFPLIIKELVSSEADIICLQEVNHFDQLNVHLKQLGYFGTFMPKTCSPAEKYGYPADGIAVFYKTNRYDLLRKPEGFTYVDPVGRQQSQCCLGVILRDKLAHQNMLVVTTHFKAKEGKENDEIRLSQAKQLIGVILETLAHLDGSCSEASSCGTSGTSPKSILANPQPHVVSQNPKRSPTTPDSPAILRKSRIPASVPVIIAGDFNTAPNSAVCKFLSTHKLRFQSLWDLAVAEGLLLSDDLEEIIAASGSNAGQPLKAADDSTSFPLRVSPTVNSAAGSKTKPDACASTDLLNAVNENAYSTEGASSVGNNVVSGNRDEDVVPGTKSGLFNHAASRSDESLPRQRNNNDATAGAPSGIHPDFPAIGGSAAMHGNFESENPGNSGFGAIISGTSTSGTSTCETNPFGTSTRSVSGTCPGHPLAEEFSTWKFRSKGGSKRIIDYIWFSNDCVSQRVDGGGVTCGGVTCGGVTCGGVTCGGGAADKDEIGRRTDTLSTNEQNGGGPRADADAANASGGRSRIEASSFSNHVRAEEAEPTPPNPSNPCAEFGLLDSSRSDTVYDDFPRTSPCRKESGEGEGRPCARVLPVRRWRMLTEAQIGPAALPSKSYPSDHISLCCEFAWEEEEE